MRITSARATRVTILIAVASATVACKESTSSPLTSTRDGGGSLPTASVARTSSHAASFAWVTGTPTPGSDSRYAGFGIIELDVDRLFPPGPCMPASLPAVQRGQTLVEACAFIENGGGGGLLGLTIASSRVPIAVLDVVSYPPGPCRTYVMRGAFVLSDANARSVANHPGDLAAFFAFQAVDQHNAPQMRGTFGLGAPPDPDQVLRPVGSETCVVDVAPRAPVGGV